MRIPPERSRFKVVWFWPDGTTRRAWRSSLDAAIAAARTDFVDCEGAAVVEDTDRAGARHLVVHYELRRRPRPATAR